MLSSIIVNFRQNFFSNFIKRQKTSKNIKICHRTSKYVKGVKKHHVWRVKSIDVNEDAKINIDVMMMFVNWRHLISIDVTITIVISVTNSFKEFIYYFRSSRLYRDFIGKVTSEITNIEFLIGNFYWVKYQEN